MKSSIKYIILTAIRDWLLIGIYGLLIAAILISIFLGNLANFESMQMITTYIAGTSRVIIVGGMIIFVSFSVARLFNNKEIELFLSKPISRGKLVISFWLAFSFIAFLVILPLFLFMLIFIQSPIIDILFWNISLLSEVMLIMSFTLLTSIIIQKVIISISASIAFYIFSRLIGFMLLSLENATLFSWTNIIRYSCEKMIYIISILTPRLDLFTKSNWLVYNIPNIEDFVLNILQIVIYIPLLLTIAIYDINKKEF